jgi:uncharacterized membrane protein
MTPRRRRLVVVVGAASIAGVIGLLAPGAVRIGVAVPAALFLPGYTLAAALFGRRLTWAERLPLSVALSLAVCITGGFVLHWSPWGLGPTSWALFVLAVTVCGAAATWLRTRQEAGAEASSVPTDVETALFVLGERGLADPVTLFGHRENARGAYKLTARGTRPPGRPGRSALAVGLAVVLAAVAVALARTPLPARGVTGYTTLSLRQDGNRSSRVRIAVDSAELRTTSYRLEVRAGGRTAPGPRQPDGRYSTCCALTLRPGDAWDGVVDIGGVPLKRRSLEVLLFRKGDGAVPYRRATLVLPGSELPPATRIWLLWVNIESLRVGVTSAEPKRTRFRLELLVDGHLEAVRPFTLLPGEQWNKLVDISRIRVQGGTVFEALLYRQDQRSDERPYYRVTLTPADF